jgi:hypothetical protein
MAACMIWSGMGLTCVGGGLCIVEADGGGGSPVFPTVEGVGQVGPVRPVSGQRYKGPPPLFEP